MSLAVTPPPEFAHVGNPVFLTVSSSDPVASIHIDIYREGVIQYTAAVPAAKGAQRINIASVLRAFVASPLVWPLPDDTVVGIVNFLAAYRLEVSEVFGTVVGSAWSSATLYAVPGSVDPELFRDLHRAGTDIFRTRFLNPDANRFLTVYANQNDPLITLTSLAPSPPHMGEGSGVGLSGGRAALFFLARPSETLHISVPDTAAELDFTFTYAALYCVNLSSLLPLTSYLLARFSGGLEIAVRFEYPESPWPARPWLFLNRYGVFETFITTGRAQTSVARPDNIADRYVPELDAFYPVDLPPADDKDIAETLKISSGYQNARLMNIFKNFALSDCIYLIAGAALVYYFAKQAVRLFKDDALEPRASDLEFIRSVRDGIPPVYGDDLVVFYADPASAELSYLGGYLDIKVVSFADGEPAGWSFRFVPGTPLDGSVVGAVTRISDDTVRLTYDATTGYVIRNGSVEFTQDGTGKVISTRLTQQASQRIFIVEPDTVTVSAAAGEVVFRVTNHAGGEQLPWTVEIPSADDAAWITAAKINDTDGVINYVANESNVQRGPAIIIVKSTVDSARHNFQLTQQAATSPAHDYVFSADTSGIFRETPQQGKYECSLPAEGNGMLSVEIFSTRDGVAHPFDILQQSANMHAVIDGAALNFTPDDNQDVNPGGGGIFLRQRDSLATIELVVRMAGKEVPDYSFTIDYGNFTLDGVAPETRFARVNSYASGSYVDWEVLAIDYIDGGNDWLSVTRDGENVRIRTLSKNTTGADRFAIFSLRQTGSGLVESRSVVQKDASPVTEFYCFPDAWSDDAQSHIIETEVTSVVNGIITGFTAELTSGNLSNGYYYVNGNRFVIYLPANTSGIVRTFWFRLTQYTTGSVIMFELTQLS